MKTFREIAEMHYSTEPLHEIDAKYRESRINALTELLTEQLNIADVSSSFTADEVVKELEESETLDDAIMFFKQNWIE